jgi:hypothetical protein
MLYRERHRFLPGGEIMRQIFQIASIAFAVHGVVFSQATWKGLRFGMSEGEVREVYGETLRKEVNKTQETVLVERARKGRFVPWQSRQA